MGNNLTKLTTVEAIFLIVIITINRIILNLPQKILSSCGSSAVLNVIYISVVAIIFTLIIVRLFKRFSNSDIIDVSEYVGGKVLKTIIGLLMVIYLILVIAACLRNFSEILYITYYGQTHIFYIIMCFIIACIIANYFGEPSIIKTNVIITIIILMSLVITFSSATSNFILQRIFPLFGYGAYNTFFSGLSNMLSFNSLFAIYFLMPMLSDKKDFKKISIISIVIISLLLLASTACLLLSLSRNINVDNISPIYTLIANNRFGNFIQHPEPLFVFSWVLSMISYTNIVVMLVIRFLKKTTGLSTQNIFILPVCIIILVVSLIPKNLVETHNMEDFLYNYMLFPMIFVIFPIILWIGNIKSKGRSI